MNSPNTGRVPLNVSGMRERRCDRKSAWRSATGPPRSRAAPRPGPPPYDVTSSEGQLVDNSPAPRPGDLGHARPRDRGRYFMSSEGMQAPEPRDRGPSPSRTPRPGSEPRPLTEHSTAWARSGLPRTGKRSPGRAGRGALCGAGPPSRSPKRGAQPKRHHQKQQCFVRWT